jgi:hypothetical protein
MNATQVKGLVFALLIATTLTVAAWVATEMPSPTTEAFPITAQLFLIFGLPALVVASLLHFSGVSSNAAFLVPFFLQWFGLAYAISFL